MKQPVAVFDEIADELGDVAVSLYFQEVLAEQTKQISRHLLGLLQGAWSATHHSEVLYVVRGANESLFQVLVRHKLLHVVAIVIEFKSVKRHWETTRVQLAFVLCY